MRAVALAALLAASAPAGAWSEAHPPPVRHVFVIVLENESYRETFGPGAPAQYLATELPKRGVLLREYFAIGHDSLPNYVAMVSGQGANPETQHDCHRFTEFQAAGVGESGQLLGHGCVYPPGVPTIAAQLEARQFTWKNYAEDSALGTPPTCRHPEIGGPDTARGSATDQYASRHVPWIYFHSVIDRPDCGAHVVDLAELDKDLATVAATPNLAFIVPDLCSDGHDEVCKDGKSPGGFAGIDAFLRTWVPKITAAPAYKKDGMLIVTFDEGDTRDPLEGSLACCAQPAGPNSAARPGGGRTGTVILSRYVKPGTLSVTPYNHYSLLRSLENLFGLSYLGYAGQDGLHAFGDDVYGAK